VIQLSRPDPGPTFDETLAALLATQRPPRRIEQKPRPSQPEPEGEP